MPMYRAGTRGARIAAGRGTWHLPPGALVLADEPLRAEVVEGELSRTEAALTGGFVLLAFVREPGTKPPMETKDLSRAESKDAVHHAS